MNRIPSHSVSDGDFAVWVTYRHGLDPGRIARKAAKLSLTVGDGSTYFPDKTHKPQLVRLGFASLNSSELEKAVAMLKKAIQAVT